MKGHSLPRYQDLRVFLTETLLHASDYVKCCSSQGSLVKEIYVVRDTGTAMSEGLLSSTTPDVTLTSALAVAAAANRVVERRGVPGAVGCGSGKTKTTTCLRSRAYADSIAMRQSCQLHTSVLCVFCFQISVVCLLFVFITNQRIRPRWMISCVHTALCWRPAAHRPPGKDAACNVCEIDLLRGLVRHESLLHQASEDLLVYPFGLSSIPEGAR